MSCRELCFCPAFPGPSSPTLPTHVRYPMRVTASVGALVLGGALFCAILLLKPPSDGDHAVLRVADPGGVEAATVQSSSPSSCGHCAWRFVRYVPSLLEQQWKEDIATVQNNVCAATIAAKERTAKWTAYTGGASVRRSGCSRACRYAERDCKDWPCCHCRGL